MKSGDRGRSRPTLVRLAVAALTVVAGPLWAQEAPPFCQGPASRDPSWSPDGERIYYSSNRTGSNEIWSIRRDGSDDRRLTNAATRLYYPFVSPDGMHVAVTAIDSLGTRVGLARSEGGAVEYLTDPGDEAADPSWLPDGRVVYSSARGGARDLWVMDLTGPGTRLFELEGDEWSPRVSAAGDRVVFATNRDGNSEVYSARLDGSDLRNLSRSAGWDGGPNWSPGGAEIGYYSRELIGPAAGAGGSRASWATAELKATSVATGTVRMLTTNRHRDQSPAWSPDGRSIAYTSCAAGNLEVWVMDADGGNSRRLTRTVDQADSTAVAGVVRRYVEGWRTGNVAMLETVFAPDGVIVWRLQGADDPPDAAAEPALGSMTFRDAQANRRPNPGFGQPWCIEQLRIVDGRLATAEVVIADADDAIEYTDQLTLYKLRGSWKIVVKSYSLRRD